jgi:hypothetical protein
MRVVNNLYSNHFNELKDLVQDTDGLLIVSPFLMESFEVVFEEFLLQGLIELL